MGLAAEQGLTPFYVLRRPSLDRLVLTLHIVQDNGGFDEDEHRQQPYQCDLNFPS